MPIVQVVMWFGIAAFILLAMLAAYTPPSAKGQRTELWLCLSGVVAAAIAFGSIFWMP